MGPKPASKCPSRPLQLPATFPTTEDLVEALVQSDPPPSSTIESLQSTKHRKLLDIIEQLRDCGLDRQLSLPQLVVCGDQSAGKSSVLEALTEISFPSSDNLCTRFATAISLRRAPQDKLTIKINADEKRDSGEKVALKAFSHDISDFSELTSQLSKVIDNAKRLMGIGDEGQNVRTFSRDVLSIEIEGPTRPQLTVVDLPGLIGNEDQKGDKALVEQLTQHYINEPRTICLAVVSAMNDADNQRILDLVKQVDPEGNRSLGIITKPDTLDAGSGNEQAFIDLACNRKKKYYFKMGWHVLRNRGFKERDISLEERKFLEIAYFTSSNFKVLPKQTVGIETLRARLSQILFNHISRELPSIRKEVQQLLDRTQTSLRGLGQSRKDGSECREYLMITSEKVKDIIVNALKGDYELPFFASNKLHDFGKKSSWAVRRLCALIHHLHEEFEKDLRANGNTFLIGSESLQYVNSSGDSDDEEPDSKSSKVDIESALADTVSGKPLKLSWECALDWVARMISRSHGRELSGSVNPLVISELFWIQSRRWESMATDHIEEIAEVCSQFVEAVIVEFLAPDVAEKVWSHFLEDKLNKRQSDAHAALHKIVRPLRDHPKNYNHYYTTTLQGIRNERAELVKKRALKQENDMVRVACMDALDCMRSIYKTKQKVFVDNVVCLAIGENIVYQLESIFSPLVVSKLSDEQCVLLAGEPESVKMEREHLQDQKCKLETGCKVLKSATSFK